MATLGLDLTPSGSHRPTITRVAPTGVGLNPLTLVGPARTLFRLARPSQGNQSLACSWQKKSRLQPDVGSGFDFFSITTDRTRSSLCSWRPSCGAVAYSSGTVTVAELLSWVSSPPLYSLASSGISGAPGPPQPTVATQANKANAKPANQRVKLPLVISPPTFLWKINPRKTRDNEFGIVVLRTP